MDLKSYLIHNHVLSLCFDTFSVAQRQGTSVPDACRITRLFFMLKALVPNWQKGSMSYQNNRIMWMNGWHYVFVTSESSLSIRNRWTKRNMHPCQSLSKIFSINSWILNFVLGISNLKINKYPCLYCCAWLVKTFLKALTRHLTIISTHRKLSTGTSMTIHKYKKHWKKKLRL